MHLVGDIAVHSYRSVILSRAIGIFRARNRAAGNKVGNITELRLAVSPRSGEAVFLM
jgi:hypothetical protein